MDLVDWAARWNPVPDDRPAQVWLPPQRTPASAAPGRQEAAVAAEARGPRSTTHTPTPQQAVDLPLPRVPARWDLRPAAAGAGRGTRRS